MARTRLIRCIAVIAAMALVTTGFVVRGGQPSTADDHLRAEWPECPHDWSIIEVARTDKQTDLPGEDTFTLPNGTSVAREKTNIPEFHDCQRIILEDGRSYGPLMAVFAAADLGEMEFPEGDSAGLKRTMAAAEIFNDSANFSYAPLAIGPKFNCLYIIRRSGRLTAKMVHVGDNEKDCARSADLVTATGTELAVRQTLADRYADSVYPPVARWDWDSVHRQQYIGIKCGRAWCEIGRKADGLKPDFVSSAPYIAPTTALTGEDRVRAIKGWYDQQTVAIEEGLTAKPGQVVATFFPHPELGSRQDTSFERKWVPVSYAAFAGAPGIYKTKANFDRVGPAAPLAKMNEISFCHGTRRACNIPTPPSASQLKSCGKAGLFISNFVPRWWARIESRANPPATRYMYKCVTRRVHENVQIPPTARWRWLADDETEWQWCPSGCCEVQVAFQ